MAINLYDTHEAMHREAAHIAYVQHPDYVAIEAEAAARGYRHATPSEIHASAESSPWAIELLCWRGGLWAPSA